MGRRLAVEWLWFMGSAVLGGLWTFGSGAESDPFGIVFGAVIIGALLYAALGIVRLTVAALRTVWDRHGQT